MSIAPGRATTKVSEAYAKLLEDFVLTEPEVSSITSPAETDLKAFLQALSEDPNLVVTRSAFQKMESMVPAPLKPALATLRQRTEPQWQAADLLLAAASDGLNNTEFFNPYIDQAIAAEFAAGRGIGFANLLLREGIDGNSGKGFWFEDGITTYFSAHAGDPQAPAVEARGSGIPKLLIDQYQEKRKGMKVELPVKGKPKKRDAKKAYKGSGEDAASKPTFKLGGGN